MRKFYAYLLGLLDDNQIRLSVSLFIVLIFMATTLQFEKAYPKTLWVNALGTFSSLLFYLLGGAVGIVAIRAREIQMFLFTIKGKPAFIIGIFLIIVSSPWVIYFLIKTITLLVK